MTSFIDKLGLETFHGASKYIAGFADMTGLLHDEYSGFNYAVSIARRLDNDIIDSLCEGPNMDYFKLYSRVNRDLTEVIRGISSELSSQNCSNLGIEPTVSADFISEDYLKTLRVKFSHKMAATRAGIGWIGKTDLLVTKEFGPRIRLASVLVKERIMEPGIPIEQSFCGDCSLCVKSCPAQASTGELWNTQTDRDAFFNAFKCMKKCRELSLARLNKHISLCGICVSVCPKGAQ